jgi:hypothetical protein
MVVEAGEAVRAEKGLTLTRKGDERFTPKWTDKRVKARVETVLAWCAVTLSTTVPERVHSETLAKVFGQQQNPLSAYLRGALLRKHGYYLNGKQTYAYLLVDGAMEKLALAVKSDVTPLTEIERIRLKWNDALQTNTFVYSEKSSRKWHPLQQMKRADKQEFWQPYLPYDYDIEACAPTIVNHAAKAAGLFDVLQTGIKDYLDNKDDFRQHVMTLTGCDLQTAKKVINGLFNGARLARNWQCSTYIALGEDYAAMTALQNDARVKCLRGGIKRAWAAIERRSHFTRDGSTRWTEYFKAERLLLDIIVEHLKRTGNPHFTEHDGWRCKFPVDVPVLEAEIFQRTGIAVKIA